MSTFIKRVPEDCGSWPKWLPEPPDPDTLIWTLLIGLTILAYLVALASRCL